MTTFQMFLMTGIAVFCTACVSGKNSDNNKLVADNKQQGSYQQKQENSRFEGTWILVSVNGKSLTDIQSKRPPFFTITSMNVTGFDGCNQFFGRIDQPANIAATRMGCASEALKIPLDLDNLLAHLQTGTLSGDSLTIPAQGRFPASVFRRVYKINLYQRSQKSRFLTFTDSELPLMAATKPLLTPDKLPQ